MTRTHHPRRLAATLLAGAALLVLAACDSGQYPNSIFTKNSEFNADVGSLFNRLFFWGTIVFVLVNAFTGRDFGPLHHRRAHRAEDPQPHS